MRLRWVEHINLVLLLAFTAGAGLAQVNASVSGKIEDASGSPVNGVKITVKSLETGASRTVTSDATGDFRISALPLGQQEIRAEKTGFKPIVRTGIDLAVGQEAVVNLRLEVGDLAQQIAVTEEIPVVNTTTSP
ncbi:MAG TPA: carboxypeptidase-like regulatory domain-containing protein, partial [Bryobacteraceae bacterium]|nr:carboxypeptidase-like regulatory domain-containing protein [Bryobacteraceae bacterium]